MTENVGLLSLASQYLAPHGEAPIYPEANRLDVSVPVGQLQAAADALQSTRWGHLAAITGLDAGAQANQLEVLYHFCAGAAIVTLRVRVPRDAAVVPSLCALVPAAGLYERELSELLGVSFSDSPNTDRLYLPDDWPAGVYPLRKEAVPPGKPTGPDQEAE